MFSPHCDVYIITINQPYIRRTEIISILKIQIQLHVSATQLAVITVRFIKSRRIAWLGHVMRMDDRRTPKKILQWKPIGTRIRGRPRKRWIADIEEDMQIMGIRRWRNQCKQGAKWRRITEKAETHSGLRFGRLCIVV